MKKALTQEEIGRCSADFKTRFETVRAEKVVVNNILKINNEVLQADIHELFAFYDEAFFGGDLDGKVVLEWSNRMTSCAGICYL